MRGARADVVTVLEPPAIVRHGNGMVRNARKGELGGRNRQMACQS